VFPTDKEKPMKNPDRVFARNRARILSQEEMNLIGGYGTPVLMTAHLTNPAVGVVDKTFDEEGS
jgi:hypothetical protein